MVSVRRHAPVVYMLSCSLLASMSYIKCISLLFFDGFEDPVGATPSNHLLPGTTRNKVTSRIVSNKIPPTSCSQVLHQFQSGQLTDPNEGRLYIRHTVDEPHFYFSVHKSDYDPVRFSSFEYGKYYETGLSFAFYEILAASSTRRVVDVGGNIGWFSLLSAALGAEVSTFEPNPNNYLRMCESMRFNGWLHGDNNGHVLSASSISLTQEEANSNVHIFPYGVAEKEGELYFQASFHNPGASKIVSTKGNETQDVKVVSLDSVAHELGWFEQDIDILKIDVEGAEHGVFLGGRNLIQSGRVKNIFMEGNAKGPSQAKDFEEIVALLVNSGYVLFRMGHHKGPTDPSVPKTDENLATNVKATCMKGGKRKKKVIQCNMWWRQNTTTTTTVTQ